MIELPLSTAEHDRLRDAIEHIRQAFEILEHVVKDYEIGHGIADSLQYDRVLEIARSSEYTDERKVEMIAEIMLSFNFLCQMDDLRNDTMYLSEHFAEFIRSGVFRPSDMRKIRREFYKTLSALLLTDTAR